MYVLNILKMFLHFRALSELMVLHDSTGLYQKYQMLWKSSGDK